MGAVTVPEWMNQCAVCEQLLAELKSADDPPLAEHAHLTAHLVAEHLDRIPGYQADCANCVEWRAITGDPGDGLSQQYGPAVVPMLGREDLLHRAGHLVALAEA